MKDAEFARITHDPVARTAHYKAMVRAYFERVTDTYRRSWSDSFHFALFSGSEALQVALAATERMIADEGRFGPGMQVLDVGCGVGGPALNIAEYSGAHITGVNIVERQLEIARRQAAQRGLSERTRFVLADAMYQPFPDASFDRVYLFDAGCHMPDKAKFYQECARVLRPGGLFSGLDWVRQEGLTPQEEVRYIEPICRYHAVPHLVTLAEIRCHLIAAGLEIEVLEDASVHGTILRNWELVDNKASAGMRHLLAGLMLKTIKGVHSIAPGLIPPVLRMLTEGGMVLAEAARAGAFLIGHWRARKPAAAEVG